MIFDRTQDDVNAARILIDTKIKFDPITMKPTNMEELTTEELAKLKRGTINYEDLNRIEEKEKELKEICNDMGYWNMPFLSNVWDEFGVFNIDDLKRIFDNVEILRNSFFAYKETPKTPMPKYYFENINDIEKILYEIDIMVDDVVGLYRQCGTFESGE